MKAYDNEEAIYEDNHSNSDKILDNLRDKSEIVRQKAIKRKEYGESNVHGYSI